MAFRAQSISDALGIYGKLFVPGDYLWQGMRENNYLVAALLLAGYIGRYFFTSKGAGGYGRAWR